jgi:putative Mg2+ transporter-C (MgtC) family protein
VKDATLGIQLDIFWRIALAALLGFIVGMEREWRGRPAGERTFALVALGASAFTALGVELFPLSAEKIMAGVATGIGFLGVGIIWRMEGGQTRGLTTAAANWAVAAIGVLCGAGLALSATLSTLLCLLILELEALPWIGKFLHHPEPPASGAPPTRPPPSMLEP